MFFWKPQKIWIYIENSCEHMWTFPAAGTIVERLWIPYCLGMDWPLAVRIFQVFPTVPTQFLIAVFVCTYSPISFKFLIFAIFWKTFFVTLLRWVETTKQVQFIVESQIFLADFPSGTNTLRQGSGISPCGWLLVIQQHGRCKQRLPSCSTLHTERGSHTWSM